MIVLVNTSNRGAPVGVQTLEEIRTLGADGIRTDILPGGAEQQMEEFAENRDLQLLALVHGGDMPGKAETLVDEAVHAATIAFDNYHMAVLPHPPIFELGNEPTE